jgi:hypothetical protein
MGGSSSVVKRSSGLVVYSIGLTVSKVGLLGLEGKNCQSMLAMIEPELTTVSDRRKLWSNASSSFPDPHVMFIIEAPLINTRHEAWTR